jgi:thiosulfate/3-mercaptopyruvate sulfurtransferase
MSSEFFVDPQWVARHAADKDVVLLDARSAKDYWAGHLPGARPFDANLLGPADSTPAGLAALVNQHAGLFSLLGLSGSEHVVVYEDKWDTRAARAAWLLHYLGQERVSILDGGLRAADGIAGLALTREAPAYSPRPFTPSVREQLTIGVDELRQRLGSPGLRVLDTRRAAEYFGEEKRARRNGAIPGAVHRDYAENIDEHGRGLDPADVRKAYENLGLRADDEIVVYCGGGARGAHTLYALRSAGFRNVRNYAGAWNEWGNREDLPFETPARIEAA